jgi:hypothetical protein
MHSPLPAAGILDSANELDVTRGSLQAQLHMAEREGELDVEPTLGSLRALLAILDRAEEEEPWSDAPHR